jgi:hypothetical protein
MPANTRIQVFSMPSDMISAQMPVKTKNCDHSRSRSSVESGRPGLSDGNSSTITTGPTSTPIMWFVDVSASR